MRPVVDSLKADGFVDAATNGVAADGRLENLFRDDNGETLTMTFVWGVNKGEVRDADGLALLVGVLDASARMETVSLV